MAVTLLSSPIWLPVVVFTLPISAIATRSRGVFIQTRIGVDGKEFSIVKLQTMRRAMGVKNSTVTRDDDPRIPRVARWIRWLKIDELPQLINVLRGDMSLVGPRPLVAAELNAFPPGWDFLLRRKPGITGAASIRWRNEAQILAALDNSDEVYFEVVAPDKLALERWYSQYADFWLDLQIILWTFAPWLAPEGLRPLKKDKSL